MTHVDAVAGADLVLTLVSFGPQHQALPAEAFAPAGHRRGRRLRHVRAGAVASEAALFLVDDREQYLANRTATAFAGLPRRPVTTIGEAIRRGTARGRPGGSLVTHLGVGLADVVFADAVVRAAEASRHRDHPGR